MPEAIGSIAFRRGGGLVAGMRSGIYALDIDSGRREALFELGSDAPSPLQRWQVRPCRTILVGHHG